MATRALICGCAGPELTAAERAFIGRRLPWGLILFKRNIEDPAQTIRLTREFRNLVGRNDAPVLIDQEGGRVQRMRAPRWPSYPAAGRFRALGLPLGETAELVRLGARLMARDLAEVGVNVDCAPVLDRPVAGAHSVIGDRAYAADAMEIAILGRAAAEGLLAGGVLPVIKHIPGHGRANADSHHELPVVRASRAELEATDFTPFRALADMPMAMTAHVVFTDIDPAGPATTSAVMVGEIMRGALGFGGLLMSDDLSMRALSGSLGERASAAISAGCDVALHCNGDIAEMEAVAEAAPLLSGLALTRAEAALARLAAPTPFDAVDGRARLDEALAALA